MNELVRRAYTFDVRAETGETGSIITGRPIVYDSRTDIGWFDEIIEREAAMENGVSSSTIHKWVNDNTNNLWRYKDA